jgi:hypothetical protein
MDYTHFMREMIFVNHEDVNKTIEVLNKLIDIYAKELYILDQLNSRDWKKQYNYQLKIDRTNQVIEELRKIN